MHPIDQQVRRVARRARRLLVVYALAVLAAVTVVAAFVIGAADYLFRFQDQGVRIICSLSVLAVILWTSVRYLYPALRLRVSDLETARRIEKRFPALADRLSSSVAFLHAAPHDRSLGSPELRTAVIAETTELVRRFDLLESLDTRTTRRVVLLLVVLSAAVAGLCSLDVDSSLLAIRRLAVPWGAATWPRRNELAFFDAPRQIATGQDFEAVLVDRRGRLPRSVELQYRFEGEDESRSRELTATGERLTARLENVTRPLRYRAVGGDDDTMPWQTLRVVQPPRITEIRITLVPPAYSGWPAGESNGAVTALEGTRLEVQGRVSKPLREMSVFSNLSHDLAADLSSDGTQFQIPADGDEPWIVEQSGSFWFELKDRDGTEVAPAPRYEIQMVRDHPPTIAVDSPRVDDVVMPDGTVRISAVVKDDLAVQSVAAHLNGRTEVLYAGPERADSASGEGAAKGDQQAVEFMWDLSSEGVKPGDTIEFYLEAADYKPQVASTSKRRLSVVSREELEERFRQAQAKIYGQLEEAVRFQRGSQTQVRESIRSLESDEVSTKSDIDSLQRAELAQRRVRSALAGSSGALRQVDELLARLERNRIDDPSTAGRLEHLRDEVALLVNDRLPAVEHGVNVSLKTARAGLEGDRLSLPQRDREQLRSQLDAVAQDQTEVITALDGLLGRMSQWSSVGGFTREAGRLRQSQEEVAAQTRRVGSIGRDFNELEAEKREALRRLATRQLEVAESMERLLSRMEEAQSALSASDPSLSSSVAQAIRAARENAVAAAGRQAARRIERNQIGQATLHQQDMEAGIQEVLDALTNHPTRAATRLEQAAGRLAERQEALATGTREIERVRVAHQGVLTPDQTATVRNLAIAQNELSAETAQLASRAGDVFGLALREASRSMAAAAAALDDDRTGKVAQQHQQAAIDRLRGLGEALRTENESGPNRQPADDSPPDQPDDGNPRPNPMRLAELKMLKALQSQVNERTREIDEQRTPAGPLVGEARQALTQVAGQQSRLADLVQSRLDDHERGPPDASGDESEPGAAALDEALRQANIPGLSDPASEDVEGSGESAPGTGDPADRPQDSGEGRPAGEDVGAASRHPLADVGRRMLAASDLLTREKTASETQQVQGEIVQRLSRLIEQSANAGDEPRPGDRQTTAAAGDGDGERPGDARSTGQVESHTVAPVWGDLWGHLPDRIREQIQNPLHEEYLPEYRELIEDYYRRLAEEGAPR